jgi:hypothetical protein
LVDVVFLRRRFSRPAAGSELASNGIIVTDPFTQTNLAQVGSVTSYRFPLLAVDAEFRRFMLRGLRRVIASVPRCRSRLLVVDAELCESVANVAEQVMVSGPPSKVIVLADAAL